MDGSFSRIYLVADDKVYTDFDSTIENRRKKAQLLGIDPTCAEYTYKDIRWIVKNSKMVYVVNSVNRISKTQFVFDAVYDNVDKEDIGKLILDNNSDNIRLDRSIHMDIDIRWKLTYTAKDYAGVRMTDYNGVLYWNKLLTLSWHRLFTWDRHKEPLIEFLARFHSSGSRFVYGEYARLLNETASIIDNKLDLDYVKIQIRINFMSSDEENMIIPVLADYMMFDDKYEAILFSYKSKRYARKTGNVSDEPYILFYVHRSKGIRSDDVFSIKEELIKKFNISWNRIRLNVWW